LGSRTAIQILYSVHIKKRIHQCCTEIEPVSIKYRQTFKCAITVCVFGVGVKVSGKEMYCRVTLYNLATVLCTLSDETEQRSITVESHHQRATSNENLGVPEVTAPITTRGGAPNFVEPTTIFPCMS